jgi:hypothetical protein
VRRVSHTASPLKKAKLDTVAATDPATTAVASATVSPDEVIAIERAVIGTMRSVPHPRAFTPQTLTTHLHSRMPALINQRTLQALRDTLKKVVDIHSTEKYIVLKAAYAHH